MHYAANFSNFTTHDKPKANLVIAQTFSNVKNSSKHETCSPFVTIRRKFQVYMEMIILQVSSSVYIQGSR